MVAFRPPLPSARGRSVTVTCPDSTMRSSIAAMSAGGLPLKYPLVMSVRVRPRSPAAVIHAASSASSRPGWSTAVGTGQAVADERGSGGQVAGIDVRGPVQRGVERGDPEPVRRGAAGETR